MAQETKHLYNLDELSDYKIKDGYPDIKGWDVKDIDNRVVGKVDNLLVNKETEQVVYLDVEVDKSIIDANHDPYNSPGNKQITEFVNNDGDNHIIIPIGMVGLNTDSKNVFTDLIDHRTFAETKRYRKGDTLDRAYEEQVLDSYGRKAKDRTNEGPDRVVSESSNETEYNKDRNTEDRNYDERIKEDRINEDRIKEDRINEDRMKLDRINEDRIRKIVRKEIKEYHNDQNSYWDTDTNEEQEHRHEGRHDHMEDDDRFYERSEFDNDRFKNRTPGL